MRAVLSVLIFCVSAAQSACAGAWLRDPGAAFTSVTSTVRYLDGIWRSETGLYGEYGLTRRLTLGIDINETPGRAGHVLMFGRVPLGPAGRRLKAALELSVGGHHQQGQWGGMLKSTLSVGRGFESPWGPGWINVDATTELRRPNPDPAYKLDATLGLSSGMKFRPILQFESTYSQGKPLIWSLTPGVLIDGRDNTTWLIGIERKTAGISSLGMKFGLWRQF